jgi:hypothetical protein
MNTYTEQILAALGNPKDLIAAGVAAVAPVLLKALSPSNQDFGFKK